MDEFEEFKSKLGDLLIHMYDPFYCPDASIWRTLSFEQRPSMEEIRTIIVATIERLKPVAGTPPTSRSGRVYEILSSRYVHERTQRATALRLSITPRHLRREQQESIQWLAQQFWQNKEVLPAKEAPAFLSESVEAEGEHAWRKQVQRELVVLQQHAPGVVADVGETLHSVLDLEPALTMGRSLQVVVETSELGQRVRLHPSILRQVVITAIEKLAQQMEYGVISIGVLQQATTVRLTISGSPNQATTLPQSEFIQEIITQQGGACAIEAMGDRIVITLDLPVAGSTTVLVVDDNVDLVHFYRRYTEGTQFQIKHLAEGTHLFDTIVQSPPDIIVLDVMLPDVDGWKVLLDLRNHPATTTIPIIICSVVRREELAKTLGATLYLTKPVRRQEFVQTLEKSLLAPIASLAKTSLRTATSSQMTPRRPAL